MLFKNQFFALLIALFTFSFGFSQNSNWNEVDAKSLLNSEKMHRANIPSSYKVFEVSLSNLITTLKNAPTDVSGINSNVVSNFPNGEGKISAYTIYNSPMIEEELALENPEIYNFTGINNQDPTNIIKISITPAFGMHIMGFDGNGTTYYIDTFTSDFNTYLFYKRNDIENSNPTFKCLVEDSVNEDIQEVESIGNQTFSIDNKFRTYRLAMACTTEYAAFHVNQAPNSVPQSTETQKKAIVLAAMNVTVNRLNAIYERDLAVRLILVANNSNIIFINSDNFSNNNASALINESQSVITSIIGTSNFDVGHTVSTGGGGLASPAPCSSNFKARGITGSFSPVGDPFDIDYVAHEVGHQFGANHTFNNSCSGNRNNQTAVEPGSGSTIMAYAGICSPNIQGNSDAYFHQISIREITNFLTTNSNNCAVVISGTNATPVITSTSGNKTIPRSTPFILSAIATDSNNPNSLTYTFEQMDNQTSTQAPTATALVGPNFRSIAPTSTPSRSFPSTTTVLAGTTNSNGIVSSTWERLPAVSRSMKFIATVRDNNAVNGGQTAASELTVTFANAGPFLITFPNNITGSGNLTFAYGSQRTITWNVAGTTANGINTSNVNILLSTDNGNTYTTLAANTPNDGSQVVTIPTLPTSTNQARIKIEAVGNIFYTVSKAFSIDTFASNNDFEFADFNLYPNPTFDTVNISFTSTSGNDISMELFDIRGRKLNTYSIENTGSIDQVIDLSTYNTGVYLIKIKDGSNESTKKIIKK